jgi:tetratricopeptide (TPR) repeat protein
MPPSFRRPVLALTAALCLLSPRGALAQAAAPEAPAPPANPDQANEARRAFQAGQQAFSEGRFEEAAQSFEEAYRIKPHASPLVNAGEAWERANQLLRAARVYQRVLEMEQAGERDRGDATERLARLATQLGAIVLVGEAGVRAKVDEDEFQAGNKVYVQPGEHKVTLVDVEGGLTGTLDVAAGAEKTVDLAKLRPKALAEPVAQVQPDEPKLDAEARGAKIGPVTLIAYGVGAVGLAGAGFFALRANSAANDFDDKYSRGEANRDEYDRFNQSKLFTNISLGVGVVGVSVGTYFLLKDLKRPARAPNEATRRTRRPVPVLAVAAGGHAVFIGTSGGF